MALTRIALDTNAYTRFRTGDSRVHDALAEAGMVVVPSIVVGELLAGFRHGGRRVENEQRLSEFLAEPFVRVAGVDGAVPSRYADVVQALRAAKTPIPANDAWIAATCLANGLTLLSFDQHFACVPGLAAHLLRVEP